MRGSPRAPGPHQRTVIVPCMPLVAVPWTEQKNVYVPASVNVTGKVFGADTGSPLLWKFGFPAGVTSWKPSSQTKVQCACRCMAFALSCRG